MKKAIGILLAAALLTGCFGVIGMAAGAEQETDHLQIVTTIFPIYDWVRTIMGEETEHADLVMLYDKGVDPHSFQPTVQDIMTVSSCDLFIYIGGESDAWVEGVLETAVNPEMKVLNLMEALQDVIREEDLTNIMQAEEADAAHREEAEEADAAQGKEAEEADPAQGEKGEEADAAHREEIEEEDHAHDEEAGETDHEQGETAGEMAHTHAEETEYDEHVWLSLRNAEVMVQAIAEALTELDPSQESIYQGNAQAYQKQLEELDQKYQEIIQNSAKNTLLFGDRFPFLYLTEDYGLNYYAAFAGCSAETEASFETIISLAQKIDELGLSCVLTIEGGDPRIAETLIQSTKTKDQQIRTLNSMQSVTAEQVASGASYLGFMEENLEVLRQALE